MTIANIPVERSFSLDEAIQKGKAQLNRFNLKYDIKTVGNIDAASMCRLYSPSGQLLIEACGKGGPKTSYAGAIFETLQDYYAKSILNSEFDENAKISNHLSHTVASQTALQDDFAVSLLKQQVCRHIACRQYTNLSQNKTIYVPVCLSNISIVKQKNDFDNFDYATIRRYSSDNGHAAGLGKNEAILHAINECVERDSLALLLYRCFFPESPALLPIIDKSSLPKAMQIKLASIEHIIKSEIILINMTTDINISAIMCIAKSRPLDAPLYGMGASLHSQHAIERAVSELMQAYWLCNMNERHRKLTSIYFLNKKTKVAGHPGHLRCVELNVQSHLDKNRVLLCSFNELPTCNNIMTVEAQLVEQQKRLQSVKLEAYYCLLKHFQETGICIVHVHIPGLDYFWAASEAQIVVPGNRARTINKKQKEQC